MNAVLGRVCWDFLGEPYWAELVSKKIQMKLSKIRVSEANSRTRENVKVKRRYDAKSGVMLTFLLKCCVQAHTEKLSNCQFVQLHRVQTPKLVCINRIFKHRRPTSDQ